MSVPQEKMSRARAARPTSTPATRTRSPRRIMRTPPGGNVPRSAARAPPPVPRAADHGALDARDVCHPRPVEGGEIDADPEAVVAGERRVGEPRGDGADARVAVGARNEAGHAQPSA